MATIFGVINLAEIALRSAFYLAADSGEAVWTVPGAVIADASVVLAVVVLTQLYRPASSQYYNATARWDAAMTLHGLR